MPPAAGFVTDHTRTHESATSSDVFGNDLGDVDIWGDDKAEGSSSQEGGGDADNAERHVTAISERDSGAEKNSGLPPRKYSSRSRVPSAELLQKQASRLNSMSRRTRRPSLSDSFNSNSGRGGVPDSPRANRPVNPHLPPMTPRTRGRKLGLPLIPTISKADPSPPKVKTLSVAEKRRIRNGELLNASNAALDFQLDDKPEPNEFVVNWARGPIRPVEDLFQSQTSLFDQSKNPKKEARHVRNFSDSLLAFNPQDNIFGSTRSDDFGCPCSIPTFPNNDCDKVNKNHDITVPPRPRVRESKKDIQEDVARRSLSLPRKKMSSPQNSQTKVSEHRERSPKRSTSPKSPRRRKSDLNYEELQNHLKTMFGENRGSARENITEKSSHSGSTKSSKSTSFSRKTKQSNQVSEEIESSVSRGSENNKPGSFRRRREPYRKSASLGNADELPNIRGSSIPRAGEKIRFVRDASPAQARGDGSDAKSNAEKSSRSAKSRGSGKSSISSSSGRHASLGENYTASASPRRRRPSARPPSPATRSRSDAKKEAAALAAPASPGGRQISDDARRSSSRAGSPGNGRRAESGERVVSRTSTTPRRKIRYVRNSDVEKSAVPPLAPSLFGRSNGGTPCFSSDIQ